MDSRCDVCEDGGMRGDEGGGCGWVGKGGRGGRGWEVRGILMFFFNLVCVLL